ncbi:MAG: hypothetical protein ACRCU3_10420 [Eubacteriaceae bacterium]
MDAYMLLIFLIVLIPGFFIVKRLSKTLYANNKKLEDETERRYGFSRFQEEEIEKDPSQEKSVEAFIEEEKNSREL